MSNEKRLLELDFLRFIAIIPVIILHANTNIFREYDKLNFENFSLDGLKYSAWFDIAAVGGWGVELFFAISGYIMAHWIVTNKVSTSNVSWIWLFYWRRFLRLWPSLFISSLGIMIGGIVAGKYLLEIDWNEFFKTILLVKNLIDGQYSKINPVTWSLETEIQFYLVFPLLIMCFAMFSGLSNLASWILLALICLAYPGTNYFGLYYDRSLLAYLQYFIVGIIFYQHINFSNFYNNLKKSFIFDIFLLQAILLVYYSKINNIPSLSILGIFLIFFSVFKMKYLSVMPLGKLVLYIGRASYSIYLCHYAIIYITHLILLKINQTIDLNYFLFMGIAIAVAITLSLVFYEVIESGFDKFKKILPI